MKILLTGATGQIGCELARSLLPLGEIITFDKSHMDFLNPETLRPLIQKSKPDVIVNAAAYTNVDQAEKDTESANIINAIAPGVLAEEAKRTNALFIHYSTDYVYDGMKETPYLEEDKPHPINAYGRSKLAGEKAIQNSGGDYIIFRTSWVYSARRNNFLLSMLKLMKDKETLNIVNDQTGAPTWARPIADVTTQVIKQSLTERNQNKFRSGIYHLACTGKTTWYGFAKQIAVFAQQQERQIGKLKIRTIEPISSEEYSSPAKRPRNSQLDMKKLKKQFNLAMPAWDVSLKSCMQEMA